MNMTQVTAQSLNVIDNDMFSMLLTKQRFRGTDVSVVQEDGLAAYSVLSLDLSPNRSLFLYIGAKTPAAIAFGKQIRRRAIGKTALPDEEFSQILGERYFEVSWTRNPAFDKVEGICAGILWQMERLLLPIELPDGYGFASFLKIESAVPQPNQTILQQ